MRPITPRADLDEEEKTAIAVFRRNSPSGVHITTLVRTVTDFFGMDVQQSHRIGDTITVTLNREGKRERV